MNKEAVVTELLQGCPKQPKNNKGTFFAPSNIALAKYWGKRNTELNLPVTSSLSISLGHCGAKTTLFLTEDREDIVFVNHKRVEQNSPFVERVTQFLNLFRPKSTIRFQVETEVNIPIGAGLASSACGFAALVGALDQLYGWALPASTLSLLARLGSGSASRSFWQGFVEWQAGKSESGMDSFGVPLDAQWEELRVGLCLINNQPKALSSREAMQRTVLTSPFYTAWPVKQEMDFYCLKEAIKARDFIRLGEVSESNALAMHALMLTANPPIFYSNPQTIDVMHKIWDYRSQGLSLYFTQDAGPNLKLLFLEKDKEVISNLFSSLIVIAPFEKETLI